MPLIEVRGLTKLYRMGDTIVRALDGVDLTIERGEFVAITGASGSGKSTMMHLLGCLDRPNAGRYVLNARDVSRLSDRELAKVRNREIGFVFQTFNLIPRASAVDNVGVALFYARQTSLRTPSLRALERVGLAQRATHKPNELSGGERQRVAIARAIVNDPPLLLADEPTGNLDTRTGEQIMGIFHELNRQGVTVIIVTHEQEIANQCRRIIQMRDGKIVSDAPVEEGAARDGGGDVEAEREVALAPAVPRLPRATGRGAGPAAGDALVGAIPRVSAGANAGLACGLASVLFWGVAAGIIAWMSATFDMKSFGEDKPPPMAFAYAALGVLGAMGLAVILAILAIVLAVAARRRMRREPGPWLGGGRTMAGLVLGTLSVAVPVVLIVAGIVRGQLGAGSG